MYSHIRSYIITRVWGDILGTTKKLITTAINSNPNAHDDQHYIHQTVNIMMLIHSVTVHRCSLTPNVAVVWFWQLISGTSLLIQHVLLAMNSVTKRSLTELNETSVYSHHLHSSNKTPATLLTTWTGDRTTIYQWEIGSKNFTFEGWRILWIFFIFKRLILKVSHSNECVKNL